MMNSMSNHNTVRQSNGSLWGMLAMLTVPTLAILVLALLTL